MYIGVVIESILCSFDSVCNIFVGFSHNYVSVTTFLLKELLISYLLNTFYSVKLMVHGYYGLTYIR